MMVGEVPVRSARAVQRQVVVRQTRGVDPGGGDLAVLRDRVRGERLNAEF